MSTEEFPLCKAAGFIIRGTSPLTIKPYPNIKADQVEAYLAKQAVKQQMTKPSSEQLKDLLGKPKENDRTTKETGPVEFFSNSDCDYIGRRHTAGGIVGPPDENCLSVSRANQILAERGTACWLTGGASANHVPYIVTTDAGFSGGTFRYKLEGLIVGVRPIRPKAAPDSWEKIGRELIEDHNKRYVSVGDENYSKLIERARKLAEK